MIERINELEAHLADWWSLAQKDFSKLAAEKKEDGVEEPMIDYTGIKSEKFPQVRKELLETMKDKFVPVGVLDKFQVAGVFVNWWDNIKYDLKTIMQNGWDPGLIPDEYLIAEFFQKEEEEIEQKESEQAELETSLEEAVEEALNLVEFEPDEEDGEVKPTPSLAKNELKTHIKYLVEEKKKEKEAEPFVEAESLIKDSRKQNQGGQKTAEGKEIPVAAEAHFKTLWC